MLQKRKVQSNPMHPYFCFITCLKSIHSFLPYSFAQHPHANISFYFPTSYYNMQIYKVRNSDRTA